MEESKLVLRRTSSSRLEEMMDSKPVHTFAQLFGLVFRFLLSLMPNVVRTWFRKLITRIQVKITQKRFGLNMSDKVKFTHFDLIDKEVFTIDGTSLRTTHLHPHNESGTAPCIIIRTPYYRFFDYPIAMQLAHRGYHVLIQDVRGRFESRGEFTLGRYEKQDAACTLRWLSQQPWSNKEVGVLGVSIGGYTCWASYASSIEMAESHGMKIKAVVPIVSSSDILKSGIYVDAHEKRHDPIINLNLVARYSYLTYELGFARKLLGSHFLGMVVVLAKFGRATRGSIWRERVEMHLPLETLDIAATQDTPQPRLEFETNPESEYWSQIDHSWAVRRLGPNKVHATFISGWYDIFVRTTLKDFQTAVNHSPDPDNERLSLIIGDFSHFDEYISMSIREAIRTFEGALSTNAEVKHYIQDMDRKRVRVICLGADGYFCQKRPLWERALVMLDPSHSKYSTTNERHSAWREFDLFPPTTSRIEKLKLAPARRLCPVPSCMSPRFNLDDHDTFVYDPHNPTPTLGGTLFDFHQAGIVEQTPLMNRGDVLVYETPPLKSVIEIAGDVWFEALISSSARSMDVFAKLCVSLPNGATYNLCEGIARRSLEIEKGEEWPQKVKVYVGPMCAQFIKGSKICLIVSSGSFPQFSRNLGYGEPTATATNATSAKQRVFWSQSFLSLPISQGSIYEALYAGCDPLKKL